MKKTKSHPFYFCAIKPDGERSLLKLRQDEIGTRAGAKKQRQFKSVVGPFRTKAAAELMVYKHTRLLTIAEAEREVRLLQRNRRNQREKPAPYLQCDSCQVLMINGVLCHEQGCPNAWRDEKRECRECGDQFEPETRHHRICPSCNGEPS